MSAVVWRNDAEPLRCRVCGFEGEGTRIADVTALTLVDHPLIACPACGSIEILDQPLDSSPTDAMIDGYVEVGAGISTIAQVFDAVDTGKVRRFLDVGCNYGFALDVGRFAFGWDVLGVEPSGAARRGADELQLTILPEYLTPATRLDGSFELVLASEVLEHVPDPVPFLAVLRERLGPEGTVVITTPAAEIVSAEAPEVEVLAAVSPGYHSFIASTRGLGILLERAGFGASRIERRRGTLVAVAGLGQAPPVPPADRPELDLLPYLRWRAEHAPRRSALRTGATVRALRLAVARGEFEVAAELATSAIEALRSVHRVDLRQPRRALRAIAGGKPVPWVLPGAAFALGMIELLHRDDPGRAAELFQLAAVAAAGWETQSQVIDLDTADLRFQSAYHRALALARAGAPVSAEIVGPVLEPGADEQQELARITARCRLLTELVARGVFPAGSPLHEAVGSGAPRLLERDGDQRVAGLDGLYSAGACEVMAGSLPRGIDLLRDCVAASLEGAPDAHATELASLCVALMAAHRVTEPPDVDLRWHVDTYWCDAFGTFVRGWIHAGAIPIDQVTVRGAVEVAATRTPRTDLLEHWPGMADADTAGFTAYVPGAPRALRVIASTAGGTLSRPLARPGSQVPALRQHLRPEELDSVLMALIADAPPGPVLALGIRAPDERALSATKRIFGDREVVGLDIHEGIGVDVVGDAHRLSALFEPGAFAVIYSSSVLEHLVAPWLFAAESAAVLMEGGRAVHVAPWLWPSHAEPNDFWRMSESGLRRLFTPDLGYAHVSSGEFGSGVTIPGPDSRQFLITMPTTSSALGAWIAAEKVRGGGGASWPYDPEEGEIAARGYPTDGLAERPW